RLIAFDRVAPTGGGLYVVDARSPAAPVALSGFAGIDLSVPSWSPDGGTIAFSSGFQLFVARLATRSTRLVAGGERPALAPDGSTIAFVRGCGADLIPAGATASPDRSSCGIPELEVPWAPAWAPDGARLAFATCYLW